MSFAKSFTGVTPPARFDGQPWTKLRIFEAPMAEGAWTLIDTQTIPLDATPDTPNPLNLTTLLAQLELGFYDFQPEDDTGVLGPRTGAVQSPASGAELAAPALPGGVSVETFKRFLGTTHTDRDDLVAGYLDDVVSFARDYTRRELLPEQTDAQATTLKVFVPEGRRIVRVPDLRFAELVTADGAEVAAGAYRLAGTPETLRQPATHLHLSQPAALVQVMGRWGFDQLPAALTGAIYAHAARNYRERVALYADHVEVGDGTQGAMYSYFRMLPPRVQAAYSMYRVDYDWFGL